MPENRIDFGEQSILLGCGEGLSEVLHINTSHKEKQPDTICTMSGRGNQLSVYGLAISPDMTYMAASTRNRANRQTGRLIPAELKVWIFDDLLNMHSQRVYMESYHARAALISVAVTDDGYLLAGSGNGELLLYELPGASPVITEQAYSGPVFDVIAISGARWATVGGNGVLKIWKQTDAGLELLWASDSSVPVKKPAMQSIVFSATKGKIYWGDGSGIIHWVDAGNRLYRNDSWEAHKGSVLALSWHSELEQLVSGGFNDGYVRVWTDTNELAAEINTGYPIVGISSQIGRSVLLFDATGKLSRIPLSGGGDIQFIARAPFRSWANFPIDIAVGVKRKSLESSIEEKIALAEAAIDSEQWGEARAFIDQLYEDGAGLQSLILFARLHRAKDQLLLEYHVWNELIKSELSDDLRKQVYYGLGDVLDKLVEPELALEQFLLAGDFSDAVNRVQKLRKHPLFEKGPFVRADLDTHERFHKEVLKNSVIGRRFSSIVVVQLEESDVLLDDSSSSVEALNKLINLYLDRFSITKELNSRVEEVKLLKGQDRAPEELKWVRFIPSEKSSIGSWIQFALSVQKYENQVRLLMYMLFDPKVVDCSSENVKKWNEEVAKIWMKTASEPEYRSWISQVSGIIEKEIIKLHTGISSDTEFF